MKLKTTDTVDTDAVVDSVDPVNNKVTVKPTGPGTNPQTSGPGTTKVTVELPKEQQAPLKKAAAKEPEWKSAEFPPEDRWAHLDELLDHATEVEDGSEFEPEVVTERGYNNTPRERLTGGTFSYWAEIKLSEPITLSDMRYFMEDPGTAFADYMKHSNHARDIEVSLQPDMQTLLINWTVDGKYVDPD